MKSIYFYQVEANAGGTWTPISGQTYACTPGLFRHMLALLQPLSNQRVCRVGGVYHTTGWRPAYFYKNGGFCDWPKSKDVK